MTDNFADKLAAAMVGHKMETITLALIDALAAILAESPPSVRNATVETVCASIAAGGTIYLTEQKGERNV